METQNQRGPSKGGAPSLKLDELSEITFNINAVIRYNTAIPENTNNGKESKIPNTRV